MSAFIIAQLVVFASITFGILGGFMSLFQSAISEWEGNQLSLDIPTISLEGVVVIRNSSDILLEGNIAAHDFHMLAVEENEWDVCFEVSSEEEEVIELMEAQAMYLAGNYVSDTDRNKLVSLTWVTWIVTLEDGSEYVGEGRSAEEAMEEFWYPVSARLA